MKLGSILKQKSQTTDTTTIEIDDGNKTIGIVTISFCSGNQEVVNSIESAVKRLINKKNGNDKN